MSNIAPLLKVLPPLVTPRKWPSGRRDKPSEGKLPSAQFAGEQKLYRTLIVPAGAILNTVPLLYAPPMADIPYRAPSVPCAKLPEGKSGSPLRFPKSYNTEYVWA